MTGIAEVWFAARQQAKGGGERFGLLLMVVSAFFFAAMAAFAKKLLPDTPIQAVVLSRGVMMTAIFVGAARWQGVPIFGKRPGALLMRGLLGYAALSCYFYSVQHLPLGDAVLLQYSHPVFVAAVAPLFLGERTGGSQWVLIAAALAGVALVVRPAGEVRVEALVGVAGSMLSGLAYIAVRKLSRTEHPMTILLWFPLATIPFSLAATLSAGRAAIPRDGSEVAGHLLVTATALVGQIALTHGLARAGAARATAVTLTGPVFGLALGFLMFGSVPTAASLAGTGVVLAALALLARSTWRRKP
ncbi:MAG: DMT family transporter [Acidobacteriia bacterium]|nr:DMT family transporter [Terriglobia bacterium]